MQRCSYQSDAPGEQTGLLCIPVQAKHHWQSAPDSRSAEPHALRAAQVGGGMGRLARDVLDHVRAAAPGVHARMRYTCVEISARLAGMQAATLGAGGAHAGRFSGRAAAGPRAGQGLVPMPGLVAAERDMHA